MVMPMTTDEIRTEAIRLAATPQGCTTSDPCFAGLSAALVGGVIGKLVQKGLLHTAYVSHKKRAWFDTAERAKQHEASLARKAAANVSFPTKQRDRAAWDAATPVIPKGLRKTIIPCAPYEKLGPDCGVTVAVQRGRVMA